MQRWDKGLKVTADGTGPIGHADAILLRKPADQAGLTVGRVGTPQHGRRPTLARSEPVRTRAPRAPRTPHPKEKRT